MLRAAFNTGRIVLAQRWGTIATPIDSKSGGASVLFTLPATIKVPANIITDYSHIHVRARCKRTGATATANFDCFLGTNGSASDSLLGEVAFAATNGHVAPMEAQAFFNTASNNFLANGTAQPQNSTGGGTFVDRSTAVNRAADMFITFAITTGNAGDSFALLGYMVTLEK